MAGPQDAREWYSGRSTEDKLDKSNALNSEFKLNKDYSSNIDGEVLNDVAQYVRKVGYGKGANPDNVLMKCRFAIRLSYEKHQDLGYYEKERVMCIANDEIYDIYIKYDGDRYKFRVDKVCEFPEIEGAFITPEERIYLKLSGNPHGNYVDINDYYDYLSRKAMVNKADKSTIESVKNLVMHYVKTRFQKLPLAFDGVGIYDTKLSSRLVLAVPPYEMVIVTQSKTNFKMEIVQRCLSTLSSLNIVIDPALIISHLVHLEQFYKNPLKYWFVICFGLGSAFSYAFKRMSGKTILTPILLLVGPRATGKTTLANIVVGKGFLSIFTSPDGVRTKHRFCEAVDATTFPILIDNVEEIPKDIKDLMKSYCYLVELSYSGSSGGRIYYARAPIIMTSNELSINDPALEDRILKVEFSPSERVSNTSEFQREYNRLPDAWAIHLVKQFIEYYDKDEVLRMYMDFVHELESHGMQVRKAQLLAYVKFGAKIIIDIYERLKNGNPYLKGVEITKVYELFNNIHKIEFTSRGEYVDEDVESFLDHLAHDLEGSIPEGVKVGQDAYYVTSVYFDKWCRERGKYMNMSTMARKLADVLGIDYDKVYVVYMRSRVLKIPKEVIEERWKRDEYSEQVNNN